jgi:hypothetical protein
MNFRISFPLSNEACLISNIKIGHTEDYYGRIRCLICATVKSAHVENVMSFINVESTEICNTLIV